MAHRAQDLHGGNVAARGLDLGHATRQALLDGVHGLLEREATGQMLLGCPADLGVDQAVGRAVEHVLLGHARQASAVCMTAVVCSNVVR